MFLLKFGKVKRKYNDFMYFQIATLSNLLYLIILSFLLFILLGSKAFHLFEHG